jgi:hypothetical protein
MSNQGPGIDSLTWEEHNFQRSAGGKRETAFWPNVAAFPLSANERISVQEDFMKRFAVLSMLLCVILISASGTLPAQDREGVVRINGGSMTVALYASPQQIEQSAPDPASLVTIYSDLGTGTKLYLSGIGWSVTGPDVAGGKVDTATPFTPKGNFNLVLVKVAIPTAAGTNGVRLSVNRDNNGAPGTAIKTWNLVNLPPFPGCCKLDLARLTTTVRVNKGVQYWLVASTSKTMQNSSDSWNMNSRNLFGTVGQRFNNGSWQVTKNSALLPAFSVLGTPAD